MTKTAIEILSLGVSLAALLGTAVVVDWPLIRAWYYHLWDEERWVVEQDQAEYMAAAMEMQELHEAGHPDDLLRYDITRPVALPAPWDVVPSECRASCYRDDEITHD
jgi:hypothetical protein